MKTNSKQQESLLDRAMAIGGRHPPDDPMDLDTLRQKTEVVIAYLNGTIGYAQAAQVISNAASSSIYTTFISILRKAVRMGIADIKLHD